MAYTGPHDIDEGFTIRGSFACPEVGKIYMRKDDPGVYYNEVGAEVSEQVARAVGYPVEKHARERFIAQQRAEWERLAQEELARFDGKEEVLAAKGGFKVVSKPNGRADVQDLDGVTINPRPLTETEAFKLFNMLADPTTEASTDE
jgi:hypothetical protein